MSVYTDLNEIMKTSGKNAKVALLKSFDYQEINEVLKFAFGRTPSGISNKSYDNYKASTQNSMVETEEVLSYVLKNNTGKQEVVSIVKAFESTLKDDLEKDLFKKIITKSLSLGCGVASINKARGFKMIPTFETMKAQKYLDNIKFVEGKEFILSNKRDGVRNLSYVQNGVVTCYARSGKVIGGLVDIKAELSNCPNGIYDGELVLENPNGLNSADLYRKSVKVINSKSENKKGLLFHVFDYINDIDKYLSTNKCLVPYSKRQAQSRKNLNGCRFCRPIDFVYSGKDTSVIDGLLQEAVNSGEEGLMLAIADAPYEGKRTKNLLKLKKFYTADLRVTGFEEGKGKYAGKCGNIIVELEVNGSLYEVGVGTGLSDAERTKYWSDEGQKELLGQLVEIKYFEVSKNARGSYSLRFPSWLAIIRTDKDEATVFTV